MCFALISYTNVCLGYRMRWIAVSTKTCTGVTNLQFIVVLNVYKILDFTLIIDFCFSTS